MVAVASGEFLNQALCGSRVLFNAIFIIRKWPVIDEIDRLF